MYPPFRAQYKTIVSHGLKLEFYERSRIYTPLLFSITLLLMFNFAFEDIKSGLESEIFVAEVYLIILFALQIIYLAIFEPDRQDQAFVLMKTYPIHHSAWFLGKITLALFQSTVIFIPTVIVAQFLFSTHVGVDNIELWLTGMLSIFGFTTIGVLLSSLTLNARGREALFPILYFPLSVPILLSSIQASLSCISRSADAWNWLGLLSGFDIVYFTLGILLYEELVSS